MSSSLPLSNLLWDEALSTGGEDTVKEYIKQPGICKSEEGEGDELEGVKGVNEIDCEGFDRP